MVEVGKGTRGVLLRGMIPHGKRDHEKLTLTVQQEGTEHWGASVCSPNSNGAFACGEGEGGDVLLSTTHIISGEYHPSGLG